MLDSLITSKTRIKLLLKFFSNSNASAHLRSLATEFGESTNAVRIELNKLSDAGLLHSEQEGRKILYKANTEHPLFPEINSIVHKILGFDHILYHVIGKLGDLHLAMVTGDYARGLDSGIIDLVLVGEIDKGNLNKLVARSEEIIDRKIRTLVLKHKEYKKLRDILAPEKALVLWDKSANG